MFFERSQLEIARVWGVPIRLDLSLLILAGIYVFRVGDLFLGLAFAAMILLSVLLHELGHTAVALAYGCRVRDITLLILGGRATLLDMPRTPMKEALMAAAGPFVSLLLGVGAHVLAGFAYTHRLVSLFTLSYYVREVNFGLLLFNLVPAFPMDGGRIFRALLSGVLGRRRATFIAYRLAQILAICMAIWALFRGFDFLLLMIAYFIFTSAKYEYALVLAEGDGGYGDDTVIISPPPYGRRNDVSDIYKER